MKINKGSVPPFGPHFDVAPGITLKAATFDDLYKLIAEYRLRQGLPPGDPESDVDDFVCSRWPHACRVTENDGAPPSMRGKPLSGRVAGWAALATRNQPTGGYALETQIEADRRAAICAACPMNKAFIGCSNCARSLISVLVTLRRLRSNKLDGSTLGCECAGFDTSTAIHFNPKDLAITTEIQQRLPQNCWLKP